MNLKLYPRRSKLSCFQRLRLRSSNMMLTRFPFSFWQRIKEAQYRSSLEGKEQKRYSQQTFNF
jgi:hypothetical protein